ncbi:MAG: hypothetical protein KatS3mg028_0614 [Bacteroidia bacterium]|nr:MAG: hypothetical protein KatS3mg028_0614 [Bacteroidia bacterium]
MRWSSSIKNELEETISRPYFDTGQDPPGGKKKKSSGNAGGEKLSLPKLWWHYQYGGGADMIIDASTLDFGGATQEDLGLTNLVPGNIYPVDLYGAGISPAALALGRIRMIYLGNNRFSIVSDKNTRFDFNPLYDPTASWRRNIGNLIGSFICDICSPPTFIGNFIPVPANTIYGGPFNIIFVGTVYIPPK